MSDRGQRRSVGAESRRDRLTVLAGLGGVTVAAWVYVITQAHGMANMSSGVTGDSMTGTMHSMVQVRPWTATEFGLGLSMWGVMMVAMMVPTAVPMTLVYVAVARKAAAQQSPLPRTFVFVAGYVAIWSLFAVAATAAQRGLEQAALLSPGMVSRSGLLGGSVLLAAGLYQFTPFKNACLSHCRSPAQFLARYWRSGTFGAFRTGLRLGGYCLGCCWILMALLFVGGVMNLFWIAAITTFVLLEKTLRLGESGGRVIGAAMVLAGGLSLASS